MSTLSHINVVRFLGIVHFEDLPEQASPPPPSNTHLSPPSLLNTHTQPSSSYLIHPSSISLPHTHTDLAEQLIELLQ